MPFEINPSEWKPQISTNRAQALDNNGRGASAGGGFAGSAFGQRDPQPHEDEIDFHSKEKKDVDEKIQDDVSNLFHKIIDFFKKLLKKFF